MQIHLDPFPALGSGSRHRFRSPTGHPRSDSPDCEAVLWYTNFIKCGSYQGANYTNHFRIADGLIKAIKRSSFNSKIMALWPFLGDLGGGNECKTIPLRDALGKGPGIRGGSSSTGDQSVGLESSSGYYFDTLYKPGELGTSNNGGMGFWEANINTGQSNVEPIGCYASDGVQRFVFDWRSTFKAFRWGAINITGGSSVTVVTPPANGHYYGQRTGQTARELFVDGSSVGTASVDDAGCPGAMDRTIYCCACNAGTIYPYASTCRVAYLTSGDLTSGEVADFHTLLQDYLLKPTGRI